MMKKMNAENIKNVVKMHPASTALAFLYTVIFIVQGNTEVFLAGMTAAFGACILEFLFFATGAIRVRRGRVRPARPAVKQSANKTAKQPVRKNAEQFTQENEEQPVQRSKRDTHQKTAARHEHKNEIQAARLKVTRIRQKTAA